MRASSECEQNIYKLRVQQHARLYVKVATTSLKWKQWVKMRRLGINIHHRSFFLQMKTYYCMYGHQIFGVYPC